MTLQICKMCLTPSCNECCFRNDLFLASYIPSLNSSDSTRTVLRNEQNQSSRPPISQFLISQGFFASVCTRTTNFLSVSSCEEPGPDFLHNRTFHPLFLRWRVFEKIASSSSIPRIIYRKIHR